MSKLRLSRPVRNQVEIVMQELDALISPEHRARAIWGLVERLDLSQLYTPIRVATDTPGRAATDPKVLLALWLYATTEGVGSARHLERLCNEHDAYRWLRGGVPVNYHMLADFRVGHGEALDELMTQLLAVLLKEGLADLDGVAQDGMRVRASAGQSSFRREKSLKKCLEKAQKQVERLALEREHPDPRKGRREEAARERAAREREERVEEALRQLPQVQAVKERQKRKAGKERAAKVTEARVSTTDPEARVMKMPDGGFRPAYNVQLATDVSSGIVMGVSVINDGTDQGEALPMVEQVVRRTGRQPKKYLMDGGFVDLKDIQTLEEAGIEVYAPPKETVKPVESKNGWMKGWRERMSTETAKEVYKQRAATAEWSNAQVSQHGVSQFRVRGVAKVTAVMLLVVLAHNLLRWAALGT
jgi:transposase